MTWSILHVLVTLKADRKDFTVPELAIPDPTKASVHLFFAKKSVGVSKRCHRNVKSTKHNLTNMSFRWYVINTFFRGLTYFSSALEFGVIKQKPTCLVMFDFIFANGFLFTFSLD